MGRERTWPNHARHPPRQDLAWAISEGLCEPDGRARRAAGAARVAFVDYSYASSIGYVASFLHNGCAAVVPHFAPGVKAGKTPASAFSRPANPRTRLVEVLQGDLVKHII